MSNEVASEITPHSDLPTRCPKVSVCVVTYNQEKYIEQCLQSLVDQKVNFEFEIIVADDCSTDGTPIIIKKFVSKYPQLVRAIFQTANIGSGPNYICAHSAARGEYIAHVDGDDYCLEGKLQKQADYLDVNKDVNVLWHRMYVKNNSTNVIVEDLLKFEILGDRFSRQDVFRYITIGANSSKMYRRSVRDFPMPPFPVLDYFANIEQIGNGYASIIYGEPLGVYRAGIGIASANNTTKKLLANAFMYFAIKYPEYRKEISASAVLFFLAALKNRRIRDVVIFARIIPHVFKFSSLYELYRRRDVYSVLRVPAQVRTKKIVK